MIEILGIKLTYETIAFIIAFVASEAIGASKLKSNSVVQLLLGVIETLKPVRKEDDKIAAIRDILNR
jgi:hypothetical protein